MNPKEQPSDNRFLTGSDDLFTAEQAINATKSPEYDKMQKNRIQALLAASVDPNIEARERNKQFSMSCDLIRKQTDGNLMADIVMCRYAGYSYKKIAKTLMKGDKSLPTFSSVSKAKEFVKKMEKEGVYRIKVSLNTSKSRFIIPEGY